MLFRRLRFALLSLASSCFVGPQIFNQPAFPQTQNSSKPAVWSGHDGYVYSSGFSGCASYAGKGRFVNETLSGVTFNPGFSSANCVMKGKLVNGDSYTLNAISFAQCPPWYKYVGDENEGVCVQEALEDQARTLPIRDKLPDYSPCSYYDTVAQNQNCKYHAFAARSCRGKNIAVNALTNACKIPQSGLNCIRKCLVATDKVARENIACQVRCNGETCVKNQCINQYHKACFEYCGHSKWCYGGSWVFPFWANDDNKCLFSLKNGVCLLRSK